MSHNYSKSAWVRIWNLVKNSSLLVKIGFALVILGYLAGSAILAVLSPRSDSAFSSIYWAGLVLVSMTSFCLTFDAFTIALKEIDELKKKLDNCK